MRQLTGLGPRLIADPYYGGMQWLYHARQGRVCTADVAKHFGIPIGTVRRWAMEDRWPAHGTRRNRYWSLSDAQASYEKRRRHAEDDAA